MVYRSVPLLSFMATVPLRNSAALVGVQATTRKKANRLVRGLQKRLKRGCSRAV